MRGWGSEIAKEETRKKLRKIQKEKSIKLNSVSDI